MTTTINHGNHRQQQQQHNQQQQQQQQQQINNNEKSNAKNKTNNEHGVRWSEKPPSVANAVEKQQHQKTDLMNSCTTRSYIKRRIRDKYGFVARC
ncbi:PREDICTED: small heat shock protein hspG3-like [Polistes dominula]|uniref:Small heat shock protein hspG3-like n=1 Tax=Polistes dominula TaxID=743375 RepID=A0ABM1IDZ9_POLDO|nr:PREDICTED: small heat shock protein hspG3-like [Polistes dominula]